MSGKPPLPNNISVASLSNPDKDGWLTKQGGSIRTWKRRWFVLKDAKLYYFKTAKDTEVTGIIPIEAGTVSKEEPFEMRKKKNTFSVKPTNGKRIYFIVADRPEDSKAWVTKINESISKLSGGGTKPTSTNTTAPTTTTNNNGATATRLTETQLTSQRSTAPTSNNDSRGPMTAAKDVIPFLQDPESKVLEFWQIWFESIPPEEDLQNALQELMTPVSLDFGVSVSVKFEKLTWRSAGPQSGFIQKMVDFFWNVGAPEAEIDRLNDVGTNLNPIRIGSWIDMSSGGGMDGGWYFPVEVQLANAVEVPDPGDATLKVQEWATKHNIVTCVYLGRDMGAVPPRQTELRVQITGKDAAAQLEAALDAFTMFKFDPPPEAAQELMRQLNEPGLVLSIITSSEGFVRLGILMPRPSLDVVTKIINYGGGNHELFEKLKAAVKRPKGPNYVEFLHLKAGYGYSVYTEGFDIVFHFALAEEF